MQYDQNTIDYFRSNLPDDRKPMFDVYIAQSRLEWFHQNFDKVLNCYPVNDALSAREAIKPKLRLIINEQFDNQRI